MTRALRVCVNLFPWKLGRSGGSETYLRWVVDIPQRVETQHRLEVLVSSPGGMTCEPIQRGKPPNIFAPDLPIVPTTKSLLRKVYENKLVPEALRRGWRWVRQEGAFRASLAARRRHTWLEQRGFDVIHCPYQTTDPLPPYQARIPYCINLHDLQHEHYPEFFAPDEMAKRRRYWTRSAEIASAIFVAADHVKEDIVHYMSVSPDKIHVIWPGPPFEGEAPITEEKRREARTRYALPPRFFLYPAVTWKHKNHVRLLQALAHVRATHGHRIPFVFTGRPSANHASVLAEASRLALEAQLVWLRYIPYEDVRVLYSLADATVVPTLFEASSLPVYEALVMGCPVACSTVANHPWLVKGGAAGLLFDPMNVDAIAARLVQLWEDQTLRSRLAAAGRERVKEFSWQSFAQGYLDVYEQVADQAGS
jgi:glycosyltransferase involved in cell wall biosynthesis